MATPLCVKERGIEYYTIELGNHEYWGGELVNERILLPLGGEFSGGHWLRDYEQVGISGDRLVDMGEDKVGQGAGSPGLLLPPLV